MIEYRQADILANVFFADEGIIPKHSTITTGLRKQRFTPKALLKAKISCHHLLRFSSALPFSFSLTLGFALLVVLSLYNIKRLSKSASGFTNCLLTLDLQEQCGFWRRAAVNQLK